MDKQASIIKLSASSIKTYTQCPKKYYFNYIEHAEKKHWDHFDLGNLCHKTLEIFHQTYINEGTSKKDLNQLMGDAFASAREDNENKNQAIIIEAKKLLSDYLAVIKQYGMPIVKNVEKPFDIELNNNVVIRGVIDRIDITKDGRFHIVDYKTTKNTQYIDDFQLSVYGIWLLKMYPDIKNFRASYILLRHKSALKSYDFNVDDIEKCKKSILTYADTISNENEWVPIPTRLCNWCDFKDICPTQKAW
jgi:putative RecB family exonuclease